MLGIVLDKHTLLSAKTKSERSNKIQRMQPLEIYSERDY